MKLFVVSDVHSFYTPLIKALEAAGFDRNSPEHWLISCGDAFDRGPDSGLLWQFLMSLERKILIKGNHDLLLDECCMREFPYSHDFSNGTVRTINDIGGAGEGYPFDTCCQRTWSKLTAYRDLLINYFETENYIFVHSWVPLKCLDSKPKYYIQNRQFEYDPDWRNATEDAWEQAMWGNPFDLAVKGLNQTGKTIVFGHWHCSAGWARDESRSEFNEDAKWDIYKNDNWNIIGLDGCTVHTGKVNVLVLEDTVLIEEGK